MPLTSIDGGSRLALCGVRPHAAMYRNHCCSRQLQSPGPARDPRHRKQTRLEWRSGQEEHQLGSHQLKATEADRGRWKTAAATPTRAQVQWQAVKSIPLERMDGSPASAENSNGLLRTHRDRRTKPDIELALGGWMSRMLQSERPDPALSEPEHRARE